MTIWNENVHFLGPHPPPAKPKKPTDALFVSCFFEKHGRKKSNEMKISIYSKKGHFLINTILTEHFPIMSIYVED